MTLALEKIYERISLKLKKQEDQARFNFLKSLEGGYHSTDFSILDPFNLQHNPLVKREQLRWVEKMGVGSFSGRFQVEHIELQNALSERLSPKGFFSLLSLTDIEKICSQCLVEMDLKALFQTFEKDPLGLLLLGYEPHLQAPLIQTRLSPFAEFYLVEEPLYTLLSERAPLFLLAPFTLAAMHTSLDLIPTFKKERAELVEKTLFIAEGLKKLGFDLTIQQFSVHINTSKKIDYLEALAAHGYSLQNGARGLSLHMRLDHTESTIIDFVNCLKKIAYKKQAILC